MTTRYAAKTEVAPDKSRAEIERLLERYGATGFQYGWHSGHALIGFELRQRPYQVMIHLPSLDKFRSKAAYEQAVRTKWRVMVLWVKSQLEAIEEGIVTPEEAFLAYALLPNRQTVGQWAADQLSDATKRGLMPPLLPGMRPMLPSGRDE